MKKILLPMKAKIGSNVTLGDRTRIFEPKLDGIRALCYIDKKMHFYSRNRKDITQDYPEFQFRKLINAQNAILDGEIVVLDKNFTPRFELWEQGYPAIYVVFDILMLDDTDLTELPLLERKKILEKVVTAGDALQICAYTLNGEGLWEEMLKRNMEGVMAKEIESYYYPGARSSVWLKIKAYKTAEAIILGYTSEKKKISSLILGMYKKNKLTYIGKVGTGFTHTFIEELHKNLSKLKMSAPLKLENVTRGDIPPSSTWVKPKLICEIKYLEVTKAGRLRMPVFERLRFDKTLDEVSFEEQQIQRSIK